MSESGSSPLKYLRNLCREERWEEALLLSRELLGFNPLDWEVLELQALIFRHLKQAEQALEVYVQLVGFYAEQKEFLKAIAITKEITSLDRARGLRLMEELAEEYSKLRDVKEDETEPSLPPFVPGDGDEYDPSVQEFMRGVEEGYESGMLSMKPLATFSFAKREERALTEEEVKELSKGSHLPPFFRELNAADLFVTLSRMERVDVLEGEELIRQGSLGDRFFLLIRGRARVVRWVEEEEEEIAMLEAGQFFGEIALLTRLRRTASVIAAEPCSLLQLSREDLESAMEDSPLIYEALQRFVYRRLIENLLSSSMVFFPLQDDERWRLAQRFVVMEVSEEYVLFEEGEKSDGLFLLAGGDVSLQKKTPRGENSQVFRLGTGQCFGAFAMLGEERAPYSAVAQSACIFLKLDRSNFVWIQEMYPRVFDVIGAIAEERAMELQALEHLWQEEATTQTFLSGSGRG